MIDNAYLLGLYGQTPVTTGGGQGARARVRTQPTPPWSTTAVAPAPDALVRAALSGRRLIDEAGAKVDLSGASGDYARLFALYRGLEALNALANRASIKGVSDTEQRRLADRFGAGLSEVGAWLSKGQLEGVRLVQGVTRTTSKTTAGVARDSTVSITAPIHQGDPGAPVAAFAGPVRFDITVRTADGSPPRRIAVDLGDMGDTPRSLDAVLAHVNERLAAAGVDSRLGREVVRTEPRTLNVNGRTTTLPAGPDRWALAARCVAGETVGFDAPETSDAVYVVQAGAGGAHQLLKFQADGAARAPEGPRLGETHWTEGRLSQTALPPGVETVRASATGPDGGLWMVADLSAGPADQPIKGVRDVALLRFDAAGRLTATRTLGAANAAQGFALAIGPDGRVAVAGAVTGALDAGQAGQAGAADSFVTVFDAEGQEQWTQRRGTRAADQATAVAFAPGGRVVVAGRAQSAMPGAAALGGWDGYVQTFQEDQLHSLAPITAWPTGVVQFGGGGDDTVSGLVVGDGVIFTAGVEGGRAVVRRLALDPTGALEANGDRDLGPIGGAGQDGGGGGIAGLALDGDRLILVGQTRDATFAGGVSVNGHGGETDGFVLSMTADLATGGDRLVFHGGAGDDGIADFKVVDGRVWLTGVADRAPGAKAADPANGYLARVDPLTGAVDEVRTWSGVGDQARPLTLAFGAGAASVLDRLGLPMGEIAQKDSKLLTAATAVRAGDRFSIAQPDGGRAVAMTLDARDTLQTLARKIEQASQRRLKVTVVTEAGQGGAPGMQRLSITARSGGAGAVLTAGEGGRDALEALGLSPGLIGPAGPEVGPRTLGLDLPHDLNLGDPAARKAAGERLQAAMKTVRDAYRALAPKSETQPTGPVPAYLTAQLANYQAALARLTG